MTTMRGASDTRLMGEWPMLISDPTWDWSRDWRILAARARELVANDPFAMAMVNAKLSGTHGPTGLRMRSLAYTTEEGAAVTDAERTLRRGIETGLAAQATRAIDAGGLMNRKELDLALDWSATVEGEGWGVRAWKPKRKNARYATCWRFVRMDRISNPDNKGNTDTLYHGLELDSDGQIVAIHVESHQLGAYGQPGKVTWRRVPWYADDGTENVIRRTGWTMPGMLRAISMFTPALLLTKQTGGVIEAHVTAKRAQACNPVIHFVEDPVASAAALNINADDVTLSPRIRLNPLQILFAKIGEQVQFTDTKFNGSDLQMFLEQMHRLLCASWGLPIEVVLAQMGKATLSSSRAGLDQFDRTCQAWQDDHIQQVARPIDRALIAEMALRGEITAGTAGLDGLSAGRYSRPPKYSTDRQKDANTMRAWLDVGRSYTAVFSEFGYNFEDEVEERRRDEDFLKANGVDLSKERMAERIVTEPVQPVPADGQPADDKPADPAAPDDDKKPDDDGENQGREDSSRADGDT